MHSALLIIQKGLSNGGPDERDNLTFDSWSSYWKWQMKDRQSFIAWCKRTDRDFRLEGAIAGRHAGVRHTKIIVACFPKSGSTFLTNLIGNLQGFSVENYVPFHGRREQEMTEEAILAATGANQVCQLHIRASEHALALIKKYEFRPIVLVRNIFDAAVSLSDHMTKESPSFPMGYFELPIMQMPEEKRISAIIDLAIPWYFNFFVSWYRAQADAIVSYEDVVLGGPVRQLEFLRSLGLPVTQADVESAHKKAMTASAARFNVGKTGRGTAIPQVLRDQVQRLATYYPDVDFSKIGLVP